MVDSKKKISDFLKSTNNQKNNQRKLFSEIVLIVGTILLATGISSLIPEGDMRIGFSIGMGLLLVIFGVLTRPKSNF